MSELDVQGLADLHRNRVAAASEPQPRVRTAYWQGRIDEFIAQNAVNEQEQAHALSIAAWEDETFIPRTQSTTTWGDSDLMRARARRGTS